MKCFVLWQSSNDFSHLSSNCSLQSLHRRKLTSQIQGDNQESSFSATIDIDGRRKRLASHIEKWRMLQKTVVPQVGDFVAQQAVSKKFADSPEKEVLYITSDFSESQRVKLNLIDLGKQERQFHKGAACDTIQTVRTITKTISSMRANKKAQDYGQQMHMQSITQILDVEHRQTIAMNDYSAAWNAMLKLGLSKDDPRFPPLNTKDLFRKPTNIKRAVGNSRRPDGKLWALGGIPSGVHSPLPSQFSAFPLISLVDQILPSPIGTQSVQSAKSEWVSYWTMFQT